MEIKALKEIGGSEWIKGDYHRIYFNQDKIAEFIGLQLSFYKTGNISSASLNGESISNCEAKRILSSVSGKFWYDVKEGKFMAKDFSVARAKEVESAIIAIIGA